MKSSRKKDYSRNTRSAAAALVVVLIVVSFIPPRTIGSIELRRANILSDLVSFDDSPAARRELPDWDKEEDFYADLSQLSDGSRDAEIAEAIARMTARAAAETTAEAPSEASDHKRAADAADIDFVMLPALPATTAPAVPAASSVQTLFEWHVEADPARIFPDDSGRMPTLPDTFRPRGPVIPIEPFDSLRDDCFATFCAKLLAARQPVRIAVLGDSFIEGDILTADLRERLQERYGGGGTGFAPMASPLTGFRRTVKTQSKGWTTYNIMQRKAAPEVLRSNFFISGWVCHPAPDASTRWETTDYRRWLDRCTAGRIFFLSPCDSRIEVTLNDTLRREFTVCGAPVVRQIAVTAPRIGSLSFRVVRGTDDFIGYGAVLEADGVCVDNYSVRSNNGQAMFWTNPSINAQIDEALDYDLVILQYGLNIMQRGVTDYTRYSEQLERMVAFVRQCFPGAAVLVLGVSDRSVRTDAGLEPMDAVPYLLGYQRQAARNAGAAFWSTCDAMRSQGGMKRFVQQGWAGKDFTHINYAGGRQIAAALVDAIDEQVECERARQAAAEALRLQRQQQLRPVIRTSQSSRIDRGLRSSQHPLQPTDIPAR